jgi:hypothetical protein
MGLFSVRGRLPQPAGDKAPVRLHLPESLARVAHRVGELPARLGRGAGVGVGKVGEGLSAGLRATGRAAIAATNDARIVAVLLIMAAVALGLEMAASFHVI